MESSLTNISVAQNKIDLLLNNFLEKTILLFNYEAYNKQSGSKHDNTGETVCVSTLNNTKPDIVLIYNMYSDKEQKIKLIHQSIFQHHFYTKSSDHRLKDSGIIILSKYPVIMTKDIKYQIKSSRRARQLSFTAGDINFTINTNPNSNTNGYHFYIKNILNGTSKQIHHSKSIITDNILLLQSRLL
jgi:hypothetical protein